MKKISIISFFTALSTLAFGQTEKMINPSDLKQQTVITEPLTLQKGFLRVGLVYSYSLLDKYFDDSGKKIYTPESTWAIENDLELIAQYGITDRLMAELTIPYGDRITTYHWKAYSPISDSMITSNLSTRGKGLGDVMLSADYQIIPSKDHKLSLRGTIDLTLPTGRKNPSNVVNAFEFDSPTGNGAVVFSPKLLARYLSYPFSFRAYLYYDYNFKEHKIIDIGDTQEKEFKWGNMFTAGGSINFQLNDWIALTNDVMYCLTGKGEEEGVPSSELSTYWSLSYNPNLIFQIRRFRLGESVSIPLAGKTTDADPYYILMIQYVF